MNYVDSSDPNYSLKVREITPIQNIGIEDLTINRYPNEQATTNIYNLHFEFAVNCWVKGVESYKASRNHFKISLSSHIEVSGCYFHEAMGYGDGGWGYGVETYASTTNCLIENNIFRKLRHAMVAGGGSNCNVWTFNSSREQHSTYIGVPYSDRDLDLHANTHSAIFLSTISLNRWDPIMNTAITALTVLLCEIWLSVSRTLKRCSNGQLWVILKK